MIEDTMNKTPKIMRGFESILEDSRLFCGLILVLFSIMQVATNLIFFSGNSGIM